MQTTVTADVDAIAVCQRGYCEPYTTNTFGEPLTGDTSTGHQCIGSSSDLNMATTWTATTGTHLGASAVWQDEHGYELQIEANLAGDNHQLRITHPKGDFVIFYPPGFRNHPAVPIN
jgi:hypothetical protein